MREIGTTLWDNPLGNLAQKIVSPDGQIRKPDLLSI